MAKFMRKLVKNWLKLLIVFLFLLQFSTFNAIAATEHQRFLGLGIGFEQLNNSGSGIGYHFSGQGGYAVSQSLAFGFHAGFSSIGTVNVSAFDFGPFAQLTHEKSGMYSRLYLDGMYARTTDGSNSHGINGSIWGFAPGLGAGLLIPPVGGFHFTSELIYRLGIFGGGTSFLSGILGLVWDF